MGPTLIVRADASPRIGMGHIGRCCSISQAFHMRGWNVIFCTANDYANEFIKKFGFMTHVMNTDYSNVLTEKTKFDEFLKQNNADLVLVDSYYIDDEYLTWIQSICPVMFIDGLYRCRANLFSVLNYNAGASIDEYSVRFSGLDTLQLIGLKYIPLRAEFRNGSTRVLDPKIKHLLITTGATDKYEMVPFLLKKFIDSSSFAKDVIIDVVIGKFFDNVNEIKRISHQSSNIVLHYDVENMTELMSVSDVCISAAGTTVYELLSQGVPSIIFGFNEVQESVKRLEPSIIWSGNLFNTEKNTVVEQIVLNTLELVKDDKRRADLTRNAIELVDGQGVFRIVDQVERKLTRKK